MVISGCYRNKNRVHRIEYLIKVITTHLLILADDLPIALSHEWLHPMSVSFVASHVNTLPCSRYCVCPWEHDSPVGGHHDNDIIQNRTIKYSNTTFTLLIMH